MLKGSYYAYLEENISLSCPQNVSVSLSSEYFQDHYTLIQMLFFAGGARSCPPLNAKRLLLPLPLSRRGLSLYSFCLIYSNNIKQTKLKNVLMQFDEFKLLICGIFSVQTQRVATECWLLNGI